MAPLRVRFPLGKEMVCAAAASTMGVFMICALALLTVMAVLGVAVPRVKELPTMV